MYCICHQVYCRGHHLTSGTTLGYTSGASLGVLHLSSSVLQRPSSNIRNNTGVHFKSLTSVYCICHQVYCRGHHLTSGTTLGCTSGASLGVLHLSSSVLQRPSSNIRNNTGVYFRSLIWVYCICYQVYCRGHHLTSGTTLRCTSGASLGCTAFAIKCTAEAII